jgi:hypothetical protein
LSVGAVGIAADIMGVLRTFSTARQTPGRDKNSAKSAERAGLPLAGRRVAYQPPGMKTTALLVKSLFVAAAFGVVVPGFAQYGSAAKSRAKEAGDAPANPAAPTKADEKEGKIVGMAITRANGGFLGLSIEGGGFKLAFYDAKKKPMAIDVASGVARWQLVSRKGSELAPLSPGGDGKSLTSSKYVQPPHTFKVFLTLFNAAGDAVENYTVDFRD